MQQAALESNKEGESEATKNPAGIFKENVYRTQWRCLDFFNKNKDKL